MRYNIVVAVEYNDIQDFIELLKTVNCGTNKMCHIGSFVTEAHLIKEETH